MFRCLILLKWACRRAVWSATTMSHFVFGFWRDTSCNLSPFSFRIHIFRQERNSGVRRRRVDVDETVSQIKKGDRDVVSSRASGAQSRRRHDPDYRFPEIEEAMQRVSHKRIHERIHERDAEQNEGERVETVQRIFRRVTNVFDTRRGLSWWSNASERPRGHWSSHYQKLGERAIRRLCVSRSTQLSDGDLFWFVPNAFYVEHVMHAGATKWTKLLTCDDCSGMTFSAFHSVYLRRHRKWSFLSRFVPVEPIIFVPAVVSLCHGLRCTIPGTVSRVSASLADCSVPRVRKRMTQLIPISHMSVTESQEDFVQMGSRRVHTEIIIDAVTQDLIRGRDLRKRGEGKKATFVKNMHDGSHRVIHLCSQYLMDMHWLKRILFCDDAQDDWYRIQIRTVTARCHRSYENTQLCMTLDDQLMKIIEHIEGKRSSPSLEDEDGVLEEDETRDVRDEAGFHVLTAQCRITERPQSSKVTKRDVSCWVIARQCVLSSMHNRQFWRLQRDTHDKSYCRWWTFRCFVSLLMRYLMVPQQGIIEMRLLSLTV